MMAAAAAEGAVDRSGATATATTTSSQFAAACGALSRYVKAAETMARSVDSRWSPVAARPLLPLMPGADNGVDDHDDIVAPGRREEHSQAGPAPPQQLTIVYGGRVLVLDDVPADRAASLLRVAAAGAAPASRAKPTPTDLPVARKASLQRFLERRVARVAARGGPYLRPGARSSDRDIELTLAL